MKTIPEGVLRTLCGRFGTEAAELEFLGGGQDWSDGILYTFLRRSETGGGVEPIPMVIKFLSFPASDEAALLRSRQRVEFVRYFGERGSRIISPEPSLRGELHESLEEGGLAFVAYAYRKARGRVVEKGDPSIGTGAFFRAMGAAIGQLHAHWEARPEELRSDGTSGASASLRGWRDEWAFMRSWCRDEEVGSAWERIRDALEGLEVRKSTYGFVHNDAHAWNLVFDPEEEAARSGGEPELTIIDFDVANYHFYLSDAANALYSIETMGAEGMESGKPLPDGFRDWAFGLFWEGYRRFRDPGSLELLDLFLNYRRCLLFMPFQEQTAKDPAWRRRWKSKILSEAARLRA